MKGKAEYIYVQKEKDLLEKVLLEDIYYIETVKSTHYCQIVYKGGAGKVKADITPLYREFSHILFRTRSSTLVNLEMVQQIDMKNRLLYFTRSISCSYTQRVIKELKERLNIRSYRD